MKKVLSMIVSALVAVSFAGLVSAKDIPSTETTAPSNAAPAQMQDEGNKPVKKAKKKKKARKAHKKSTESGSSMGATPGGVGTTGTTPTPETAPGR